MPRKPRLHYHGAMYHVISRGNNRQNIFLNEKDYKAFLERLKAIREKKSFGLYAYCLMPNHIHLLIEVKKDPLSLIMQRLLTGYTAYYNGTNKKRGHLFQGRYKAILCQKNNYLMELVRYIHLNPLRAKMVKKPGDYQWSGHNSYLNKTSDGLIEEDELLKQFSQDKAKARQLYEEFVRDGAGMGHRKDFYPEEKMPYLGEDKYIEEHAVMHMDMIERQTSGAIKARTKIGEVLKTVCADKEIEPKTVQGDSRRQDVAAKRKEFIIKAYKEGYKVSDIARFINRDHSFVSRIIESN